MSRRILRDRLDHPRSWACSLLSQTQIPTVTVIKAAGTAASHMSPSDITAIQNALLHKCMDYGRVVHIVVDKRSLFGCVYMKLNSMSSALAIYTALHGSWFKGRLITAKYIAPERYHKWFPAAENAVRTIYPSDT